MKNSFKIENTEILLDFSLLEVNDIEISSMPYNYTVRFINANEAKEQISNIVQLNGDKHFVFIDKEVAEIYGCEFFDKQDLLTLTAEEDNKVLDVATILLDKLQEKNFTKKELFLSVGGGITQDISAFGRAVYKRGINWVYFPTTLLAMGDSCIGAKSCLNYGHVKNQLGLFSAPKEVYINIDFLNSLDKRDVLSGYGEIIKLAIVGGSKSLSIFSDLIAPQGEDKLKNIDQLIKLSLLVKKSVIEIDEFEDNIRRALNYGHTVGHAIEPLTDYKIPHGIAVSIGVVVENLISAEYGQLPLNDAIYINNMVLSFIDELSLSYLQDISVDAIVENMKRDKKTMNTDVFMAVPFNIGYFDMVKVPIDSKFKIFLKDALDSIINLKNNSSK